MNFIEAVKEAAKGRKIKRRRWDNNNHELYITADHPLSSLIMEDLVANDWEVVGLQDDQTEQTNQYIGPMILVQIISNSVEKLEKEGIEALFDTYPEWFKNAICNGKVKVLTIENELIFKVKTFKGEEVNVFLNDFIGKSDVEGEVYPWFYIHLD